MIGWKDWPFWLKGGLIGLIVYIIIGIISYLLSLIPCGEVFADLLKQMLATIYLPSYFDWNLAFMISSVARWFIAGALVSLIIYAIKKIRAKQRHGTK